MTSSAPSRPRIPSASPASSRPASVPPARPSQRPSTPPIDGVRVVALPLEVRAVKVADASREAMLAILGGIGTWTKRDVAAWLAGPYGELTSLAAVPEDIEDSTTFRRIPRSSVTPQRLDDVLRSAKEEVLATMILAAPPDSDVRFCHRAISSGHVVRTKDVFGRAGWTPVDAPGMLLADRILSLATVDYLMRPADYLALLSVCGICQAVSFDAQVRVRGTCPRHAKSVRKIAVSRT
jgi:hypothetical protein